MLVASGDRVDSNDLRDEDVYVLLLQARIGLEVIPSDQRYRALGAALAALRGEWVEVAPVLSLPHPYEKLHLRVRLNLKISGLSLTTQDSKRHLYMMCC